MKAFCTVCLLALSVPLVVALLYVAYMLVIYGLCRGCRC